jgi:hypothetical protein
MASLLSPEGGKRYASQGGQVAEEQIDPRRELREEALASSVDPRRAG